ncbi:hypothetical protein Hanom_Chr01g00062161 [Helianthus anomalus]
MSLNWRMNREDKPMYMEGDKCGKMSTVAKGPNEELWYHRIMRNFVLPRDDDLAAQPVAGAGMFLSRCYFLAVSCALELSHFLRFIVGELSNLGIGPEKKRRAPTTTAAPKKSDTEKAQPSKAKNVGAEKKSMRRSSVSWCDYVVVSDSLEGLAPVVI